MLVVAALVAAVGGGLALAYGPTSVRVLVFVVLAVVNAGGLVLAVGVVIGERANNHPARHARMARAWTDATGLPYPDRHGRLERPRVREDTHR